MSISEGMEVTRYLIAKRERAWQSRQHTGLLIMLEILGLILDRIKIFSYIRVSSQKEAAIQREYLCQKHLSNKISSFGIDVKL